MCYQTYKNRLAETKKLYKLRAEKQDAVKRLQNAKLMNIPKTR